ncbi:MAG: hypothetical protein HYU81_01650 [Candidatus Brennerbacteria bacterium]|nr:hypothetical protein [Candidatus Brennerbacteria bacterium]
MKRTVMSALVLIFVLLFSLFVFSHVVLGITAFVAVAGSFLLQGLRNIPNEPPQKGVLTFLGARQKKTLKEGWNFFPFFPFVFGFVLVPVTRISKEFVVKTKTPDLADSEIPIAITYRPLDEHFIEFLNNGGHAGIETQLNGKIEERVREWAISDEEGPQDWKELQKSRLEATSVLTKTIGLNSITEIPSYAQSVPTVIWMGYFMEPRPTLPTSKSEEEWMKDGWKRVNEVYDPLVDTQKEDLKTAVKSRREEVKKLRTGTGSIVLKDLGVKIERLNVGDVKVLGEVAKAAEKEAKEEEERKAERFEISHVQKLVEELMKPPYNFSSEQALEVIQTERSKVTKMITESKLNISPETREMIKIIIPQIISAFGEEKGGEL